MPTQFRRSVLTVVIPPSHFSIVLFISLGKIGNNPFRALEFVSKALHMTDKFSQTDREPGKPHPTYELHFWKHFCKIRTLALGSHRCQSSTASAHITDREAPWFCAQRMQRSTFIVGFIFYSETASGAQRVTIPIGPTSHPAWLDRSVAGATHDLSGQFVSFQKNKIPLRRIFVTVGNDCVTFRQTNVTVRGTYLLWFGTLRLL